LDDSRRQPLTTIQNKTLFADARDRAERRADGSIPAEIGDAAAKQGELRRTNWLERGRGKTPDRILRASARGRRAVERTRT